MADSRLTRWRGRQVLITGHSGFVGAWVATMLRQLGATVTGYAISADEQTRERSRWLASLGVRGTAGDVRDFAAVRDALAAGYDTVLHLAGQPLVAVGWAEPRTTFETNVLGTVNVLEAARHHPPAALVCVTSDKCYRNRGTGEPYREGDELGGGCPYSVSKAAAELVAEGYWGVFRQAGGAPRTASVRLGNVIGGGDLAARRLVPDCLAALAGGRPVQLRDPAAVRPFQHVLDVAHGLLLLAGALAEGGIAGGEAFNFGPPGTGVTARELATTLAAAWGGGRVTGQPGAGPAEDQTLRLDGSRAAVALSWRHRLDAAAAADWIVRWHRAVAGGVSPGQATAAQVAEFLGLPASGAAAA